ncbi:4Fe-4S binding protein [Anaeromicrobium sediminis]|nr:4Fe-4S double cluster binding domain-containing protein [Anaeromicrobium sediminis]
MKSMPPMGPGTNNECINCGICAKHCPMNAINFENVKEVDINKCKRYPTNAKAINHEAFKKVASMLVAKFNENRCEPELFI